MSNFLQAVGSFTIATFVGCVVLSVANIALGLQMSPSSALSMIETIAMIIVPVFIGVDTYRKRIQDRDDIRNQIQSRPGLTTTFREISPNLSVKEMSFSPRLSTKGQH